MASNSMDNWLTILFEHGIDLANRRVFVGEITAESALAVTKGLYALETESDKDPVDVFINSPGGDVEQALGIYDILNTLRCPVHTFASGVCMSAAPLLLAAGRRGHRWVAPNLRLMVHDWAAGFEGKGRQVVAELKYTEDLDRTWLDLFAAHTNRDAAYWRRLSTKAHDHYFSAEQALEYGVADNIWQERD